MGCTSSKAHAELFDEQGRVQLSPKAEAKRRRKMAKEAARAEKLRQRLPSPVVAGDDIPPWLRQREVYAVPSPSHATGYHSYGAVDDGRPQQYSYSEKPSAGYR